MKEDRGRGRKVKEERDRSSREKSKKMQGG